MLCCRNHDCQGIMLRHDGGGFVCPTCRKQYTTEQVRGPFTVIQVGQIPPRRGRAFHASDRCLNPNCDALEWIYIDDPAPGRTHRMCAADDISSCRADWPEVPYTADRCFWCHHTQTRDMQRNGVLRRECALCCREWLHPSAPEPLIAKVEEPPKELPDEQGWVKWHGGHASPVAAGVPLECQRRDMSTVVDYAESLIWRHYGWREDIVKYRVIAAIPQPAPLRDTPWLELEPQPYYRDDGYVGGGCTPTRSAPNLQGFAMWAYTMNRLGGKIG